jgi:TetR/AcrR family transcriptional regulator, transcriptional repressor of bet genes
MSKRPNTEQRRAEIVSALQATIAECGYAKATIQLIAQKAGLSPGLLHYHFKTKGEILLELVKTLAGLSQQRYAVLAATAQTPEERLIAYINARLATGEGANPTAVAAWVMIGAEAVRQPEVRAIYQQAIGAEFALLQALLTDYLQTVGKPAGAVDRLAAGLLALMEGAFQLASAAPGMLPNGYAAAMAIAFVSGQLAAEP